MSRASQKVYDSLNIVEYSTVKLQDTWRSGRSQVVDGVLVVLFFPESEVLLE